MQRMPNGEKAIADKGYNGEPAFLATPNRMDSRILKKFKRRACACEPYWDGSRAQQLLMEDLEFSEKYSIKPRVLHLTWVEYQLFNRDSF